MVFHTAELGTIVFSMLRYQTERGVYRTLYRPSQQSSQLPLTDNMQNISHFQDCRIPLN